MNEQLQNAVAEMIAKAVNAFEKGADFMAGEIPDIVRQLLVWHMTYSSVRCAIGVLMLTAWVFFDAKLGMKLWKSEGYGREENFYMFYLVIGSFVRLIFAAVIWRLLNLTWLQILIAPKVWLIEYAAALVK